MAGLQNSKNSCGDNAEQVLDTFWNSLKWTEETEDLIY